MTRYLRSPVLRGFALVTALSAVSCMKPLTVVSVPPVTPDSQPPVVSMERGDTLNYIVALPDRQHRSQFLAAFEAFIERYPYAPVQRDSMADYVLVRMAPPAQAGQEAGSDDSLSDTAGALPDEQTFAEQVVAQAQQTPAQPTFGGTVTMYADDEEAAEWLGVLTQADPFTPRDSTDAATRLIDVRQAGARRLQLTLTPEFARVAGRQVSSFELVEKWTAFARQHPAEAYAMFRHVKGMGAFLKGQEAVIPGFGVSGSDAVSMVLDVEDAEAITRLSTDQLVPPSLRMGWYSIGPAVQGVTTLKALRRAEGGPPFLEQVRVALGRDRNALVSFSLRKYDCMVLTFRDDIEYSRKNLLTSARMLNMRPEAYFLSVNAASADERRALRALVNPQQILQSAVKAEGSVIGRLESVQQPGQLSQAVGAPPARCVIVYRKADLVAGRISARLVTDLSRGKVACEVKGLDLLEFERALLGRQYTIAIGSVSSHPVAERTDQLWLASVWFQDRLDESARIDEGYEVPLFALQRYFLCRDNLDFAGGTLAGMYLVQDAEGKERRGDE